MPVPSPISTCRRAAVAAASTLALGGAAAALAPADASASTPACRTSQLVATVSGGQGAAGTFYAKLTLANLGGRCTLRGYPGVSAVDVHGRQMGASARRVSGVRERTVTLGAVGTTRASTAYTTVGFVDTGDFSDASCKQRLAAGIRVYPPGQRTALAVPVVFDACTVRSKSFLTVQALR